MGWKYTPHMIPLVTAAAISAVLALSAWRRRPASGKMPLIFLMLSVAEWSFAYTMELVNTNLETILFWAGLKYLGIVIAPVAWLSFALQYTGREQWLKPRNIILLAVEPFATLLLVWTNDLHGLIWSSIGLQTTGSFPVGISTYGPWFWIHAVYSYALLFLGAILIIQALIRSPHLYRGQTTALLIGVLAPWAGNVLYFYDLSPFPKLDPSPFAFTLSGCALAWGLFRYRLLDIVPAARDAVIESMDDVVIVLDSQDRIVDLNPTAQHLIDRGAPEVIGQPGAQVLANWPELVQCHNNTKEGHSEIGLGEGEAKRYFDLGISPLHDRHGILTGRFVVFRDITKRKQAEEILQKAHDELEKRVKERTAELMIANEKLKQEIEERERADGALRESLMLIGRAKREWESTADSLSQLVCLLDDQGYILRTNRTVERWDLGKVVNVKGRTIHELFHPRCTESTCYLETFLSGAWEGLSLGRTAECEAEDRIVKRYLHIQVRPTLTKTYREGEEIYSFAVVVVNDITERKRAEEQLSKLFRAVEQSPATVMITDTDGNIEYVNPKFTQITGYTFKEVIGENPRILKSGETSPEEYNSLWKTVTSGGEWQGEFHNKKKNGELYWESASISPIRNSEGAITHFLAVKEDVTERKQLEEQFQQSQKMEAMGRLAGGIAHDFNNLLTPIGGYAQLAMCTLSASNPMRDDLKEIQNAAERAANLIRQLMTFSRPKPSKPQVVNLNNIMLDMDKMLRRLIGEHIELIVLPTPALGLVKVDPSQFEQVIVNLAVNARDAMPNGGKLTLETKNITLDQHDIFHRAGMIPGKYIMLAVSDMGIGMTNEVKAHLFEPFFTTKERGKGTGLGLSTVYGIVNKSGGHIWVYSELGQGTTIKIYLPQIEEAIEALPRRDEEGYLPSGNEAVLVVEDEPSVRRLAARVLREQGYTVTEAANGDEAMRVVEEHPSKEIHLLLTDVVMPRMGGKELADRLKTLRPDIKVLFISGYTDNVIIQHGLLDPDVAFLEKPFSPSALARKVREVLDR